jgi:hypothetical protein
MRWTKFKEMLPEENVPIMIAVGRPDYENECVSFKVHEGMLRWIDMVDDWHVETTIEIGKEVFYLDNIENCYWTYTEPPEVMLWEV